MITINRNFDCLPWVWEDNCLVLRLRSCDSDDYANYDFLKLKTGISQTQSTMSRNKYNILISETIVSVETMNFPLFEI